MHTLEFSDLILPALLPHLRKRGNHICTPRSSGAALVTAEAVDFIVGQGNVAASSGMAVEASLPRLAARLARSIASCALVGLTGGMLPGVVGGLLADLHRGARDQVLTECGAVTYACAITANYATGIAATLALGWRGALVFGVAVNRQTKVWSARIIRRTNWLTRL